ncbi:YgfZ/GcvT domain-containing protein [Legionella hackeliae]|nr:folate-binding protein YgfZ [Legionella hackeliae]
MNFDHYLINHRPYTFNPPLEKGFALQHDKNYLFELPHLGILGLQGERAQEFLQGQLTCDLYKVTPNSMRQGAQCNLKGRILSLVDVIYWQQFQLILPKDLLLETQNSLSKTALLSRVTIKPDETYKIYGFYSSNPDNLVNLPTQPYAAVHEEGFYCYSLSKQLYIFVVKNESINEFHNLFTTTEQSQGSLTWHYLMLTQKQVQIYPETRGLFLPHRLDLHLTEHLSFDKGCYKGQEIIARMHYKSKLKHGLRLFLIESSLTLIAGQKIVDSAGQVEIGELIDFCPLGENNFLIATSILLEHPSQVRFEDQEQIIALKNF